MTGTADSVQTDEEARRGEDAPLDEAEVIEQGIPPEMIGKTTDIVSRDWVGSGHSGPDDEFLEEADGETDEEPAAS